ncbi:hypothetical protein NT6N_08370 [Oceaniferula spumae]|uniref:Chromosome partition protein Smc n=1 Tax=Oceaniferula spumae TaxID=2979115 RepID=A0AAT9FIP2_9BACT
MLSDLLTSSRGPGVIGTFLALIVLVGFGTLMMVVSDDSGGSGLNADIKAKESAIKALEGRTKHWQTAAVEYDARRKQADELESLKNKLKRKASEIPTKQAEVAAAKESIVKLNEEFEAYKEKYRIAERARAAGEKMETLTTTDGKVYEQVKVLEVTALGMKIMHKSGNTRVHYERLPTEMQDRFQFTKEAAAVIAKREAANVASSVKKADGYHTAVAIRDLNHKIRTHRENISKWKSKTASLQSQILSNDSSAQAALESARQYRELYAQGRRGLTLDNAKKAERKAERYRASSDSARREISAMSRRISESTTEISKLQKELSEITSK